MNGMQIGCLLGYIGCIETKRGDAMEWQPIEIAPREEWILCFWRSGFVEKALITNDGEDYTYHTLWDGEAHRTMPTHWMPLPPQPKIKS